MVALYHYFWGNLQNPSLGVQKNIIPIGPANDVIQTADKIDSLLTTHKVVSYLSVVVVSK